MEGIESLARCAERFLLSLIMRPTHVDMFSVVSFAFVDQLTVSKFGGNNNRSIVPH